MSNRKLKRLKKRLTKANRVLLELGYSNRQIYKFWEECIQEAEIQQNLPKCKCADVNQCSTWCRAKARFAINPPIE